MTPLHQAARMYAEAGWKIIPLRKGEKQPANLNGIDGATSDLEQVDKWWEMFPHANIGLSCEGLLVLDIDGADNPWAKGKDCGDGPRQRTPRGGTHHLYRAPGGHHKGTIGRLATMVDTKGTGGYIVAAPSIGVDKETGETIGLYDWETNLPAPNALPDPPQWLIDALGELQPQPRLADAEPGEAIPEGQRNATLTRYAGGMRRMGMDETEIAAALVIMGQQRCSPQMTERECRAIAASVSRYEPDDIAEAVATGLADRLDGIQAEPAPAPEVPDPGPLPAELLRVPGFVSQVMEHTLETAPQPNEVLAFGGALALQATLAGRKVRDAMNNRTNIYILALANSATGKDHPRKINAEILEAVGMEKSVGDAFASGEGLQDALLQEPCMLFQTDEIDHLMRGMTDKRDARASAMSHALLTLYSSANRRYIRRKKAGEETANSIDQPHLVLFGTAVPQHYFAAMDERVLTGGLFARMMILESGTRYDGRESEWKPVPEKILEPARYWADYQTKGRGGNLAFLQTSADLIPANRDAKQMLVDVRVDADQRCNDAQSEAARTVWGRVREQTRKLALVYACSEKHENPMVTVEAVQWAHKVVTHQAARMLWQASQHVADGEFHASILKLVRAIRENGGSLNQQQARTALRGRKSREFLEIVEAGVSQGVLVVEEQPTGGRPARTYRAP